MTEMNKKSIFINVLRYDKEDWKNLRHSSFILKYDLGLPTILPACHSLLNHVTEVNKERIFINGIRYDKEDWTNCW